MNHYCLCCAHCPDDAFMFYGGKWKGKLAFICPKIKTIVLVYNEACAEHYILRPEPQFSQRVEVLKMLGVDVD